MKSIIALLGTLFLGLGIVLGLAAPASATAPEPVTVQAYWITQADVDGPKPVDANSPGVFDQGPQTLWGQTAPSCLPGGPFWVQHDTYLLDSQEDLELALSLQAKGTLSTVNGTPEDSTIVTAWEFILVPDCTIPTLPYLSLSTCIDGAQQDFTFAPPGSTEGVDYTIEGKPFLSAVTVKPGDSITVVASPQPGYVLSTDLSQIPGGYSANQDGTLSVTFDTSKLLLNCTIPTPPGPDCVLTVVGQSMPPVYVYKCPAPTTPPVATEPPAATTAPAAAVPEPSVEPTTALIVASEPDQLANTGFFAKTFVVIAVFLLAIGAFGVYLGRKSKH